MQKVESVSRAIKCLKMQEQPHLVSISICFHRLKLAKKQAFIYRNSPSEPGFKKRQYEPPGALELLHLINCKLIKSTLVSGDVHRKDWSSDLYKDQEGLYNCRWTR